MDYLSPKLDIVFKRMFGDENNKDILQDFLKTYLDIEANEKDLILKNTEITPKDITMKFSRFDLRVSTKKEEIDIEIQVNKQKDFHKRTLYYASLLMNSNVKRGQKYADAKRVVILNILNHRMFPQYKDFFTTFILYDPKHKIQLTDALKIHILELPKIKNATLEQIRSNSKIAWAAFFNAESEEEFDMLRENTLNRKIQKAISVLGKLSVSEKMRSEAQKRENALFNERSALSAERAEGRAEGRVEGRKKEREEIIKKMRKANMSEEQIKSIINS